MEPRRLLAASLEPFGDFKAATSESFDAKPLHRLAHTAFLPDGVSRQAFSASLNPTPSRFDTSFASFAALTNITESEPNNSIVAADATPLGFDSGEDSRVAISGSFGSGTGSNTFTTSEENGSIPTATPTNIGPNSSGIVFSTIGDQNPGVPTDTDFFKIEGVAAGETISLDIDARSLTPPSTLDSVIGIYNSTGSRVATNDDFDGLDSALTYTAATAGDYFVVVRGFGGGFQSDPFDPTSTPATGSQGDYQLTIGRGAAAEDVDVFAVALNAGDIIGGGIVGGDVIRLRDASGNLLMQSEQDATFIHPSSSPLPGGDAAFAYVVGSSGTYFVETAGVAGTYTINLTLDRPTLESEAPGTVQTLFLDFDGATIDTAIFDETGIATLSPLSAFLTRWGLTAGDEDALIDAIVANINENITSDLAASGLNPNFGVQILNSRDHADPFGSPNVSRVIVGGTIDELGISTIGLAQTVDIGNFDTTETAVTLLDLLSEPASDPNSLLQFVGPQTDLIELIAEGVGNITAHEIGHFTAAWHTDQFNAFPDLMDQGGNLANTVGVGPDGIFGTGDDVDIDFAIDEFVANEGFEGIQDSANAMAWGLSTGLSSATVLDENSLFFTAELPSGERELFLSDGTSSGTAMVTNLYGSLSALPRDLTMVGDQLFFTARHTGGQRELFVSDGTAAGTQIVRDISGAASSNPEDLVAVGNELFFTAVRPDGQRELFKSDGTAAGTVQVANISGVASSDPDELVAVGNRVFFVASLPDGQREVFRSDGTSGGTGMVRNISGGNSADPADLTVVGPRVYFSAALPTGERELFITNGTSAGTRLVRNISGGNSADPQSLTRLGNKLFFTAVTPGGERELFRSTGSSSTTFLVRNISGSISSDPRGLTAGVGQIFFSATLPSGERELFRSDGTNSGTTLIRNVSGATSSLPQRLTKVGSRVAYTAELPSGERELFRSNGTSSGTTLVENFSGAVNASPKELTNVNNDLYFVATRPDGQRELHVSRTLTNSTTSFFRNLSGTASSNPADLTAANVSSGGASTFRNFDSQNFQLIGDAMDVDENGSVSILDALLVINQVRRSRGAGTEAEGLASEQTEAASMDANGDGKLDVTDALAIINRLRREQQPEIQIDLIDDDAPSSVRADLYDQAVAELF